MKIDLLSFAGAVALALISIAVFVWPFVVVR